MATATLENVDDSLVPEYEDRYTAYKKLIIGLAEKLGSEDVLAIAYLENLPEDYKTLSPLGVLQRLERSNKFDQNHLSDLLYMLKSINRADLLNYVDEYRRKYSQPKRNGSDPTPRHGRWAHRRNLSSQSGLTLQLLAEIMQENSSDSATVGSQLSISSANSNGGSIKMADSMELSLDAAGPLQQSQQRPKEGSLSPIDLRRSSSEGLVGSRPSMRAGDNIGVRTPPPWSPSRSPQPCATQLSVVSPQREWKVDRDKLNRAIYNHKESEHRKMPRPIDLNLAPLGLKCHAKFHFILHPYGVDMDRGKNATLEVMIHFPGHITSYDMDNTKVVLQATAYDQAAQEVINTMTVEGVLNQHKMLVFGFVPHLVLKESHSQWIVIRGQITLTLTKDSHVQQTNVR